MGLISTASGCFHLHSADPLFHQFISMSGTSILRARSPELLQRSFDRVAEIFGTNDLSPQEQVQHLLNVPVGELRGKLGRQIPLGPMVDDDMIHETTTFQALAQRSDFERLFPGAGRCKRVLVGDCQMDVSRTSPSPIIISFWTDATRPRHLIPGWSLAPTSCPKP